jgi:hypothetical protein
MTLKMSTAILTTVVALAGAAVYSAPASAYGYSEYGWHGSTIALPTPPATPNPSYVWVFNPQTGNVRVYYYEQWEHVSPHR